MVQIVIQIPIVTVICPSFSSPHLLMSGVGHAGNAYGRLCMFVYLGSIMENSLINCLPSNFQPFEVLSHR